MSDIRLPQRPMVELAPPVDGLDHVRGEAGRRRRRRAGLAAASLTTAAGVAVVVALSGAAGGVDVLKPAPPAGRGFVEPSPTAAAKLPTDFVGDPAVRRHSQRHRADAGHGTTARRSVTGSGAAGPRTPDGGGQPSTSARHVSGASQPTLTRWESTYTGAPARQCSGSTYGGPDDTFESSVGWCLEVTATTLSDGVNLHVQLCRDSTGGGTLTFDGTREVDLEVRQNGKTAWDWASLHPGSSGAHQFSEPANGCMNWSLVWPGLTNGGESAGHGSFTFVGTSTANEMKGKPDESAPFSY